ACFFFFFSRKTAYELGARLVGSERGIRDSLRVRQHRLAAGAAADPVSVLLATGLTMLLALVALLFAID
ncbi:hypothetical protein, partial [Actinomadura sp. BRA 177]|uniref:hypothetical protein n=1 Tax=Actinomadura sp. BRA 177 TaxID=2745202 RepID=UPI001C3E644B